MFQCPSCKKDNLLIRHLVQHRTYVDRQEEVGDSDPQDLEWDDSDGADCLDCGWDGTVGEMTIEDPEDTAEDAKEREEDRPCSA